MFENLKKFSKILVTGTQRSGTSICARIISEELGLDYYDEDDFGVHSFAKLQQLIESTSQGVYHCPAISSQVHLFNDLLVVFVLRDIRDVILSQKRINWFYENADEELRKYGINPTESNRLNLYNIKLKYWHDVQSKMLKNTLEIDFNDLKNHHLFINKRDRVNFKPRQCKM